MATDENHLEAGKIRLAIENLAMSSDMQRQAFKSRAIAYSKLNRLLTVGAGVFSLVAAGSIASVLTNIFNPFVMQILAVISATISALVSGIISAFFNDKTIGKLFSAASQYLEIREAAKSASLEPGISAKTLYRRLEELQGKYVRASEMYGELIPEYYITS